MSEAGISHNGTCRVIEKWSMEKILSAMGMLKRNRTRMDATQGCPSSRHHMGKLNANHNPESPTRAEKMKLSTHGCHKRTKDSSGASGDLDGCQQSCAVKSTVKSVRTLCGHCVTKGCVFVDNVETSTLLARNFHTIFMRIYFLRHHNDSFPGLYTCVVCCPNSSK